MILSPFKGLTIAVSIVSLAQISSAFWRLPCNNALVYERVDPIVSPNAVSGHLHTVSGGSNFSPFSTFDAMRQSDCTSCMVKQDLSAYWTPPLFFQWANGSFTLVNQIGGGLIYYLQRFHESDTTPILAFPDGLRMLIGNPNLRSYESGLMADAIGWDCLGGSGRNPTLPTENCPQGLRGELRFPSCWDGVNTDSADHFSHMAYSDGESGPCPSTHPNRIVTLFYEMMWDVNSWNDYRDQAMNPSQPFVLSMGDPTGCGYHADFFDGWDKTTLQTAIEQCTDDSGVIQNCPVFDLQADGYSCQKTPDVDEIVTGTLPALPGCNPVFAGPGNATTCKSPTTPTIFTNPAAYTGAAQPPGAPVLPNTPTVVESYDVWVYEDCYSDNVSNRALPNGLTTVNQTVESCLDACKKADYSFCGIEYHGQCWGGNELMGGSTALGYTWCGLTCTDNPLQYCGGGNPTAMELYTRGTAPKGTGSLTTSTASTSATAASVSTASSVSLSTTISVPVSVGHTTSVTSSTTGSASETTTTSSTGISTESSTSAESASASTSATTASISASSVSLSTTTSVPATVGNTTSVASSATDSASETTIATFSTGTSTEPSTSTGSASKTTDITSSTSTSTVSSTGTSVEVSVSTEAPTSTAASQTSSLTSTGTTSPSQIPGKLYTSGWTYSGCFSDLVPGRSLPNQLTSNSTIPGCLAASEAAGFAVAALSYMGECWAGGALSPASTALDPSKCKMACKNAPLQDCGGAAALDVYISSTIPVITTPTKPDLTEINGYSFTGCYSDLVNNQRSLPHLLSSNSTIEGCINACAAAGMTKCGLEYYGECWAGSALSTSSTSLDPSQCTFSCKNNPLEHCGGDATLSVYILTTSQETKRAISNHVALGRRHRFWSH